MKKNQTKMLSIMVMAASMFMLFVGAVGIDVEAPSNKPVFSVSQTQKVYFSPGNLQWNATGSHAVADGETMAGTWRFAPNQWDTIGADNSRVSSNYAGWIDLFGWGTSGYDNKHPYMTNTNDSAYGNGNTNISGTNYDWGVYNAIYNTKTNQTDDPGTWRTLTKDEWVYLLETRITPSGVRYAKATVNGVPGVIVVPDNWATSIYTLYNINIKTAIYASNVVNTDDWAKMEDAGCVFLSAAGERDGQSVSCVGYRGSYWSATCYSSKHASLVFFNSEHLSSIAFCSRYSCKSVRLVKDVQ